MIARLILIAALAPLLGACDTLKGSVAGSCPVFERPPYVVLGKTQYDQDVADKFVESGVAGCNWARPAARPASIEAPIARKPAPAKRRGLVQRIRDRVLPAARAAPVEAPIAPTAPAPPAASLELAPPPRPPPPAPRSAIDELLYPRGSK